ncbi:MAG TPA: hypothetical protein DCL44_01960 [Elusimicrobia bacterium]|nr:hypothetical protein [Elusimicrobiota bacterium]
MRKKVLLFALATIVLSVAGKAAASDSFQFAPPPFPILNLRSIDAERNSSYDYIGMSMGDFRFDAVNFGGSRAVKKWDHGGVSLGGNFQVILGRGKFDAGVGSSMDLVLFGEGGSLQPNLYFDLYGDEEDNFSLPFYFGPHISANMMMGSVSFKTTRIDYSRCGAYVGSSCVYWGVAVPTTDILYMTNSLLMYGWQAGIQAGINLGEYFKFIPYIDFSQELGGVVGSTMDSTYSGSSSSSLSVPAMPITAQPGFDLMFRKINLNLGGAIQNTKSADGSGTKIKTVVFHLRFQKKFRSICGI